MKVMLMGVLLLASVYCADASPKIRWHDPAAQERAIFKRGRGVESSVLVKIPISAKKRSMARAFRDDGVELPVSVVHQSSSELYVLVRTGEQKTAFGSSFLVYYGQSPDNQPEPLDNEDSEPVTVEIFTERSRSIPMSWERMLYMISQKPSPASVNTQRSISDVTPPPVEGEETKDRFRHRHNAQSTGAMVHISTHIVIPEDGLYSFAIDCNDAGFVMVDREINVSWPGRHLAGQVREGSPVFLKAGPHMLEIYGAAASVTRARVSLAEVNGGGGYKRVERMTLVSSAVPVALRIENKDKTIHAGFGFSIAQPYRFRGMNQTFVPVVLEDFSRNDLSSGYDVRWFPSSAGAVGVDVGNGTTRAGYQAGSKALRGPNLTHLFDSTGLHNVRVEVRDTLGFVSSMEREVDTRNIQFMEYSVNATPVNVFPCMYGADMVEPSVRVVMSGGVGLDFVLAWKWLDAGGKEHTGSARIQATEIADKIKMFSAHAEDVAKVDWELSHHGYRLDGGTMKFCHFPFDDFPVRASEDRLYGSDGAQLVYVSSRGSPDFKQARIGVAHLKGGVTCFDDMLATVRPLSGEQPTFSDILQEMLSMGEGDVRKHQLSTRGKYDVLGVAELLLDTADNTKGAGGVAVLSMGREHFEAYDNPEQFERILAGCADILLSRRAMRTVLVTMPPMGSDREAVRKYAVAARRVADARGVPVADLYSGFSGMGENLAPFEGNGSELSDEGLRLAGQIIVRTIIAGYGMEGGE